MVSEEATNEYEKLNGRQNKNAYDRKRKRPNNRSCIPYRRYIIEYTSNHEGQNPLQMNKIYNLCSADIGRTNPEVLNPENELTVTGGFDFFIL